MKNKVQMAILSTKLMEIHLKRMDQIGFISDETAKDFNELEQILTRMKSRLKEIAL